MAGDENIKSDTADDFHADFRREFEVFESLYNIFDTIASEDGWKKAGGTIANKTVRGGTAEIGDNSGCDAGDCADDDEFDEVFCKIESLVIFYDFGKIIGDASGKKCDGCNDHCVAFLAAKWHVKGDEECWEKPDNFCFS